MGLRNLQNIVMNLFYINRINYFTSIYVINFTSKCHKLIYFPLVY